MSKTGLPVLGLSCDGCGLCCSNMTIPPFIRLADDGFTREWTSFRRDYPALAAELDGEVERRTREHDWPDAGPCTWFDTGTKRCKNYEARPIVCRDFDLGGEGCLEWRRTLDSSVPDPGAAP